MWPTHGKILLGLLAGSLLVLAADLALLGPSHGGWINLDFRGLLIGGYLGFVGVHAAVSSVAVRLFKPERMIGFHVFVAVVEVGLVIVSLFVWMSFDDARRERRGQEHTARVASLAPTFTLRTWRLDPQTQTVTSELDSDAVAQLTDADVKLPSVGMASLSAPQATAIGANSFDLPHTDRVASGPTASLQLTILVEAETTTFDFDPSARWR